MVFFPFSLAFASPPADTIKLNPPEINKTRQITPAMTKELRRSTLTSDPMVGKDVAGVKMSLIATVGIRA